MQILETAAFAAAAIATGSSALVAQTFAAGSDIAAQVFLAIGVSLSVRDPTRHIRSGTAANATSGRCSAPSPSSSAALQS
jgi:hypothetical protein